MNFSGVVCPMLVQLVDPTFIDGSGNTFEVIHLGCTYAHQGVRNASFSENFANVLNE